MLMLFVLQSSPVLGTKGQNILIRSSFVTQTGPAAPNSTKRVRHVLRRAMIWQGEGMIPPTDKSYESPRVEGSIRACIQQSTSYNYLR